MSQTTLNERNARLDHYLQNQMRKTGNQVRLIDLFTCCMKLFAGVLGGLFLLAIVDGWIFELAGWARWLSLLMILGGALTYIVVAIVPLLVRKINPVYAAKVVEESQPDMKNSLINYLLLRQQQGKVSRRVVEIVGSKAANDISGVPVENTVDKSHTIQAALILTGLVVALGAYKVVSPKDPFQSFARIIAPASAITKPARVSITQVEPGNTDIFFGQELEVTAFIDGVFDPETAKVEFSTLDGQIVDGSIRMMPGQRDKFSATLRTGDRGIEQSLKYKVVAGDGVSNEYTVNLTSSPILTVERISYEPAAYMDLESYTQDGVTTIEQYEGTNVTLEAVANTNIKSCHLQLLREDGKDMRQVDTVSMQKIDDRHAKCDFKLLLNAARNGPRYTHYQLHLITDDDARSRPIAANRILVKPDGAPEIQVVDPQETELEVPANSRLRFEVRANDIDFKLSGISVAVEDGSRRLVQEDLQIGKQEPGQSNKLKWEFWPKKSLLRAGDIVEVQFAAFDNRESEPGQPEPNMTLTDRYRVVITDPIENPPSENQNQSESEKNKSDGQGDKNDQGQSGESGDQSESGESGEAGEGSDGAEAGEQGDQSQSSEGAKGEGQSGEGESGDQSSSAEGEQGSESSDEGESQNQSSGGGEQTGEGGQADSDAAQSGGQETGQSRGQESGEAGQDNSQSGQSGGEQARENQSAGQAGDQNNDDPIGEDAHDSEIFEEVQKFREQQASQDGQQNQDQQGSGEQNQDQNAGEQNAGEQNAGEQNAGEQNAGEQNAGEQAQNQSSGDQSQQGSPENGKSQSGQQDAAQSAEGGTQQPESGGEKGNGQSQTSQQQDESQSGDEQGQQQQSGESPKTDDQGMDQKGQSDAQSTNEGNAEQESGQSGQSQQEQDSQSGSESGDQSSGGSDESQQEEKQDQQQQQEGGGSDTQESEQQQSAGGGNQDEQTGSGGGEQETSGSQQGEKGQQGQQQGESGGAESSGDQQNSQGSQSDSSNQEQSGSGSNQDQSSQSGEQSSSEQSGAPSEGEQKGSQSGGQDGNKGESQESGGQQDSQSNDGQEQGQSGNQQSEQANQQGGQSSSGEAQQGDQKQQGDGQQSGTGGNQGEQNEGQSSEQESGGNKPGSGSASSQASSQSNTTQSPEGGGTEADEANMEYTKKATDMALEYLEDQAIKPDPKLLDKLNWSEDDLRDFVKRWKELKQAAASGDEKKKLEYERALESLGLGEGDSSKRRFEGQTDDQQGYQEDGRVDAPPPEFADRFRAFSRERNKARDER